MVLVISGFAQKAHVIRDKSQGLTVPSCYVGLTRLPDCQLTQFVSMELWTGGSAGPRWELGILLRQLRSYIACFVG